MFVLYSCLDDWLCKFNLPFEITFRKMRDRVYLELEERKWNLYFRNWCRCSFKGRNVSAIALQLLEERGQTWLFDCGEATQHQILHTSVRPRRIEKIFITHLHGDHIFGLPGLLGSRSFQGGTTPLTVYGPKGIKQFIEVALSVSTTHVKYPLEVVEITEEGTVFEDNEFYVETKRLSHGIECFGYRIVEKDIQGALLVDKLLEMGVKPGPIFKRLKDGEVVELEDGTILNGNEFIGPPQKEELLLS